LPINAIHVLFLKKKRKKEGIEKRLKDLDSIPKYKE